MAEVRINRKKCIACHSCTIISDSHYGIRRDGKAALNESRIQNGVSAKAILDDEELRIHREAQRHCPMHAIDIVE